MILSNLDLAAQVNQTEEPQQHIITVVAKSYKLLHQEFRINKQPRRHIPIDGQHHHHHILRHLPADTITHKMIFYIPPQKRRTETIIIIMTRLNLVWI